MNSVHNWSGLVDRVATQPNSDVEPRAETPNAAGEWGLVLLVQGNLWWTRLCLGVFGEGRAKYFTCDFAGAIARLKWSAELEPRVPGRDPGVVGNPSRVYIDIAGHFAAEPPPAGWDGVYVMKEK
jgi:hypothetical protein